MTKYKKEEHVQAAAAQRDKIIIGVVVGVLVVVAVVLAVVFGLNANAAVVQNDDDVILVSGVDNMSREVVLSRSVDGGKTWTAVDWPLPNIQAITHDGTRFHAAGSLPVPQFCTSADGGLTWSTPIEIPAGAVAPGKFCVVTGNGKGAAVAGGTTGVAYYDGSTWMPRFACTGASFALSAEHQPSAKSATRIRQIGNPSSAKKSAQKCFLVPRPLFPAQVANIK